MAGKTASYNLQKTRYFCGEAKRLLDYFGVAVQELLVLHEEQFLAVVRGDNCIPASCLTAGFFKVCTQ